MKALSILQPWAALIVAGVKDIENRTWPTRERGEILVHAGKGFDMEAERGGIIGSTEIVDCVRQHPSPWKAEDSHGFVLRNAKPLPFRPLRGQLGFFEVPA